MTMHSADLPAIADDYHALRQGGVSPELAAELAVIGVVPDLPKRCAPASDHPGIPTDEQVRARNAALKQEIPF